MNAGHPTTRERRVVLLPATRRDGHVVAAIMSKHHIVCEVCASVEQVAKTLALDCGVLILTDQLAADEASHRILEALLAQPAWSDVPVILLCKIEEEPRGIAEVIDRLTNVTLLERPTSVRTLLSAVEAALRSRMKQYQIRDQLAALHEAERSLRASDRLKDEFLAMLAHELRNPLAPIRAAVEVLPKLIEHCDPRTGATLAVIDRQLAQLTRLVDDLLDVSRITQGRIEIQRSPVNLAGVIAQALESVEPLMMDKKHKVCLVRSEDVYVEGDAARLVQSVSNILTNAGKYTDPGGTVSISLDVDGANAVIAVSDTGVGIPPELLPHIFDLFVQNERALDRSEGGLGIGLSVVRRLIDMQGGRVQASSPGVGMGSTFRITLPAISPPVVFPTKALDESAASRRILIVDDNVDAASSLDMLLSLDGHVVQSVFSAEAAIEAASAFDPDIILLDIGLPVMSGYEVARRMRAVGCRSTIIALTGYGQQDDVDRALSAGFDAHVAKPLEYFRLQEIVARISQRREP